MSCENMNSVRPLSYGTSAVLGAQVSILCNSNGNFLLIVGETMPWVCLKVTLQWKDVSEQRCSVKYQW